MFYETAKRDHGLPHDPFKAIVAPRPIGWISTLSARGEPNLAPYSFFNAISSSPDMVCFSSQNGTKDSISNIRETGEFVCNFAGEKQLDAMNASSASAPHGVNEFEIAGLEPLPCNLVSPSRVGGAPAALECRMTRIVDLSADGGPEGAYHLVIGEVIGIHIDEQYLTDGIFDLQKALPVTRLGYRDYSRLGEMFVLDRPSWKG
ncbi:MAG: flavin reductase family protein [Nitratireductor sp.]|nr:flavin reductase family protein [Nitratireductor sp.]